MLIEVPDKIEGNLAKKVILLDFATGLYVAEHATRKQAAEMAGISELEFLQHLEKVGIRPYFDMDDLEIDLQAVAKLTERDCS